MGSDVSTTLNRGTFCQRAAFGSKGKGPEIGGRAAGGDGVAAEAVESGGDGPEARMTGGLYRRKLLTLATGVTQDVLTYVLERRKAGGAV